MGCLFWGLYPHPKWYAELKIPIFNVHIITACKHSLRRLCFYRCLSVHGGGGVWSQVEVPASGGVCSGGGLVLRGVSCPGRCLVPGGCLLLGGPGGDTPRDGYCCGWYASYWNAFLCLNVKRLLFNFNVLRNVLLIHFVEIQFVNSFLDTTSWSVILINYRA